MGHFSKTPGLYIFHLLWFRSGVKSHKPFNCCDSPPWFILLVQILTDQSGTYPQKKILNDFFNACHKDGLPAKALSSWLILAILGSKSPAVKCQFDTSCKNHMVLYIKPCTLQMCFLPDPGRTRDTDHSGVFWAKVYRELKQDGNFFPMKESGSSPKPSCINFVVDEGVKLACVYWQGGDPFKSSASSPLVEFVVPVGRGWL